MTFEDGKIVCVQKAKKEGQKSTRVINCCICICCIAITRWTKMTNSFFRTELELFSVTFFLFQSEREMNGADEMVYTMTIGEFFVLMMVGWGGDSDGDSDGDGI